MASTGPVTLTISENASGRAHVVVSYLIEPTGHDLEKGQRYRELVQLIGVDTPARRGEDGTDDIIPGKPVWDGVITFPTTLGGSITQIHEFDLPSSDLDEDPGPIPRTDEILARVTLTPFRDSNIVRRGMPPVVSRPS